jgi:cytochrome P450
MSEAAKPPAGPSGTAHVTEDGVVNISTGEFARCPHATYRELIAHRPVAINSFNNTPVISRYEDALWALRHPEIFSSRMEMQVALGTERPMIPQQIDPPAQTKYRKVLDPRFSKKRMLEIEPDVRRHANELIDGFIADGACEFDQAFAVPLPCTAFLSLMGLPQSELPFFLKCKDGIIRPHTQLEPPFEFADQQALRVETGREIYRYFEDVIAERRRQPGTDMVSYLLETEVDGHKLTDEDILDVSFLLILAGLDTVTATLGCNIAYLAANPKQREALVAEPKLIPAACEELLRWETPVTGVPRIVKQDVTLHGHEFKAGDMVTILLGASNIDGGEFDHPDDVDFERDRNRHLAFGGGPHRCLGSHLARMELQVAMEVWHQRIPSYAVAPGEAPRYSPGIREVQYLPLVWETA